MRKIIVAGLLSFISFNSFAADCLKEAKEVAKINLDQVAHQYGFETSDVSEAKLIKKLKIKISKNITDNLSVFNVYGSIYKGTYTLTVTLDDSCAIHALTVHDDSTL